MSLTNIQVAELFCSGLKGSSLHMTSTGDKLFSYNTCIAQYNSNDYNVHIIGNATSYSSTTSRHLNYIRSKITEWTTKQVPYGAQSLLNYL